jgi:hypothetical protein
MAPAAAPLAPLRFLLRYVAFEKPGMPRMISLNPASWTAFAASLRENHWTSRSSFSGQSVRWRFTSRRKTCTSQITIAPFDRRFSYVKAPIESLPAFPTTPASSRASRAAEACGAFPSIGQPFGMTQRPVSREVTSITSTPESALRLKGSAAY